jgi:hypothetical protein
VRFVKVNFGCFLLSEFKGMASECKDGIGLGVEVKDVVM